MDYVRAEPEALAELIADASVVHARLPDYEQLDLHTEARATAVIRIPARTLSLVDGFADYGS